MKIKTSVSLSENLLAELNSNQLNRSEFLEMAAWEMLNKKRREEINLKDKLIYATQYQQLNTESANFRKALGLDE